MEIRDDNASEPRAAAEKKLSLRGRRRNLRRWILGEGLTATEEQHRRKILATVIFIPLGGLMLMIFLWNFDPSKQVINRYRAVAMVDRFEALWDEEKFIEAYHLANRAQGMAPDAAPVMRITARIYEKLGIRASGSIWQRLVDSDGGTESDQLRLVSNHLMFGDAAAAEESAIALKMFEREDNPETLFVQARLHATRGNRSLALAALDRAAAIDPDHQEIALVRGSIRLSSNDPEEVKLGADALFELSKSAKREGIQAVQLLMATPIEMGLSNAFEMVHRMREHPLATDAERLEAYRYLIRFDPHRRSVLIHEALADFKAEDIPSQVILFRWLEELNEDHLILSRIEAGGLKETREFFPFYINALAKVDRWEEFSALLEESPSLPVPEYQRYMFKAFAAERRDRDSLAAATHLRTALGAIQQEEVPQAGAMRLAKFAETYNHLNIAEEAFRMASTSTRVGPTAFEGLLRLASRRGDTASMRDIASEVVARYPGNKNNRERLLYLRLLLGESIEVDLDRANELIRVEGRGRPQPQIIAALAHLRLGDTNSASAACRDVNPYELSPGQTAIYNAATGMRLEMPSGARLLPEERMLAQSR